jgi:protein pelota
MPRCACCARCAGAGGGEVSIFSGMHTSGEQLNQLTGIAAVLRFPLPDLEDQEFDAEA